MINLLTERIICKRGYEIMTVKQREMKIEALVNDLKAFGDDDLKRLLGFVEGMKVGISKREAKKTSFKRLKKEGPSRMPL